MPTRQEQKAETHSQILSAAAIEIARVGFRGTTLAGIAAVMGKPRSAMGYHHFKTKEDIAVEIIEVQYRKWDAFVNASMVVRAGLPRFLSLVLTSAIDAQTDQVGTAAMRLLSERDSTDIDLPEPPFDWKAADECAAAAVEAGQLPADADTNQIMTMLIDSSLGVIAAAGRLGRQVDLRAELYRLWRALLTGVGASDVDALIGDTIVVVPLGSELDRLTAPEA